MADTGMSTKWLIVGAIALAGLGLAGHHVGKQGGMFPNTGKYKGWEWRIFCIDACRAWRSQVREIGKRWEDVAVYPYDSRRGKKMQRDNAIQGAKNVIDAETGS